MNPAFLTRRLSAVSISCVVALVAAGCTGTGPTSPSAAAGASQMGSSAVSEPSGSGSAASGAAPAALAAGELNRALAELRAATARYHDLAAAEADGFVLATPCEGGEVASVYVKPDRMDGTLDPTAPEGLLYTPGANGQPRLVGVELVLPYGYGGPEPPAFFGHPFQAEDEFGVWGLHVWIWQHNPTGMFAVRNPTVTCAG